MSDRLALLTDPDPVRFGADPEALLRSLGGPTCIVLTGRQPGRPRAVVTLLHGNEPSGTHAIWRFLRAREQPLVDTLLCLANVEAALWPPLWSKRHAPGRPDLNRCFRPPFTGRDGALCQELLALLRERRCEALVDLHNTSGHGPGYAVCTHAGPAELALASLFAPRAVHTDLRLGSLMEATEDWFPTVTVECGGARAAASHELAFAGLRRFVHAAELWVQVQPLSLIADPIRIELDPSASVAFADRHVPGVDLTLRLDIEQHNFEPMRAGQQLGYVGQRGLSILRPRKGATLVDPRELFIARDGRLLAAAHLELLMVTTDPVIAREDCLFYVVLGGPDGLSE